MTLKNEESAHWLSIIAKSLSFLCLHVAELRNKELTEQLTLLEGLGLSRRESAMLLGTTEESLRVLKYYKARKSKGGKRAKKSEGNKGK